MAEAALKKELTFPEGGIADFYKTDAELEAMDREDAKQQFGEAGIANFEKVATKMASYGRFGDDKLVHAETGELVVPKALIQDNPELKESIFNHLREMGIEDPERYVVGSDANSLNPETGLPEFFLKKIFKGVSKALSGVGKVLKKAAPIIIPIALNAMFPGLGAIYSGALGAGIGTLVQGGSMKDAFKNALIGGAIGGATAGVQGAVAAKTAGTSLSQGAVEGIKNAAKFSNLQTAGQQLATGQFGQSGYEAVTQGATSTVNPIQEQVAKDVGPMQVSSDKTMEQMVTGDAFQAAKEANLPYDMATDSYIAPDGTLIGRSTPVSNLTSGGQQTGGMFDNFAAKTQEYAGKTMDFLTGADPTQKAIDDYAAKLIADNPNVYVGETGAQLAQQTAKEALSPGFLRTYGPSAALGGAGLYAAGFFDAPEQPPEEEMITGADLLAQDPGKYTPGGYQVTAAQGPYTVASNYGYVPQPIPAQPPVNPFLRPIGVAEGGEIFPRRVGGIMPDEGIPGQDSVRAMLMPGEFVMTTNAVKGLGNGNNQLGINRMYDMMRGLESKGKAMA